MGSARIAGTIVIQGEKLQVFEDGHGTALVLHDLLGFSERPPRFVEVMGAMPGVLREAAARYVREVTERIYPGAKHQYHMKAGAAAPNKA